MGTMWNHFAREMQRDDTEQLTKVFCVDKAAARYLQENYAEIYESYFAKENHIDLTVQKAATVEPQTDLTENPISIYHTMVCRK